MKTKLTLQQPSETTLPLSDLPREHQAEQRWGHTGRYHEARQRSRQWTPEQLATIERRWQSLEQTMAAHLRAGQAVGAGEVQATAAAWVDHLHTFYTPNAELVAGLADLYAHDPDFAARYEQVQPGLASYLQQVLTWHAVERMS